MTTPEWASRTEPHGQTPLWLWRFDGPRRAASTASVGGGIDDISWVMNVHVRNDYARRDLTRHAADIAAAVAATGRGTTMFTAAKLHLMQHRELGGVSVDATVGISRPTWAADTQAVVDERPVGGTINIVIQTPVRLTDAALLGALCTATEAKTQALAAAGVDGSGTASDAVTVVCPRANGGSGAADPNASSDGASDAVHFAGVRSVWGSRIALATYQAVVDGAAAWRRAHL